MSARKDAQFSIEELENVRTVMLPILGFCASRMGDPYADIVKLIAGRIESASNGRNSFSDDRKVEFNVS